MASIKLGELLVKAHVLQESQLRTALAEQRKWGGRLGEILVRMSLVTEDLLTRALARQLNVPTVNLDAVQGLAPNVKAKLPARMAKELGALPLQLRDDAKTLVVAMSDPTNLQSIDVLRAQTRCRIQPQLAGATALARAFNRFYGGEEDVSDVESSFKVVDAQGRTVLKHLKDVEASAARAQLGELPEAASGPRELPPVPGDAESLLRQVEQMQRQEVAVLKAMVELLIQKGVFTRDEYLAKVKR